jgi:hypothetical protein
VSTDEEIVGQTYMQICDIDELARPVKLVQRATPGAVSCGEGKHCTAHGYARLGITCCQCGARFELVDDDGSHAGEVVNPMGYKLGSKEDLS